MSALQFGFHIRIHDKRLESRNGRADSTAAFQARPRTAPPGMLTASGCWHIGHESRGLRRNRDRNYDAFCLYIIEM